MHWNTMSEKSGKKSLGVPSNPEPGSRIHEDLLDPRYPGSQPKTRFLLSAVCYKTHNRDPATISRTSNAM